MKLTIIGTGYVGLSTGTCFADMGHTVCCYDYDQNKIDRLNNNERVIFEPYLFEMIESNKNDYRLGFTSSLDEAIDADIFFICVGTPSSEDGSANLEYVIEAAKQLGKNAKRDFTVVNKSTVPIGTGDLVKETISEELRKRDSSIKFGVISNPEFLKQGSAVNDFLRPDRIVVGYETEEAKEQMIELYRSFTLHHHKIIFMSIRSAEMTKYVSNSMLATKISFMNEISNICELLKADVEDVRRGVGSDERIGYSFTYPGCGYGGSCFPKDVEALIYLAEQNGFDPQILKSVKQRNFNQKKLLFKKLSKSLNNEVKDKSIAVWGLSFKPETDDMREAPSITLVKEIIEAGGTVKAYDPAAMEVSRKYFDKEVYDNGSLELVGNPYTAAENVDALVLVTEWKVFRNPDFALLKSLMKKPVIIDGRNQYTRTNMENQGFVYEGMGK